MDHLFAQFGGIFGSLWHDFLAGAEVERTKSTWGAMLAGCTGEQLATGLRRCEGLKFPPSASYFLSLCRPRLDPTEAWHLVSAGAYRKNRVLYHAVQSMGGVKAMQEATYQLALPRWEAALRRFEDLDREGKLEGVPQETDAPRLPPPDMPRHETPAALRKKAADLIAHTPESAVPKSRQWARAMLERAANGGNVPYAAMKMAASVIEPYSIKAAE